MKERPILFSAPMVRAILNTIAGAFPPEPIDPFEPSKGVTRRVIRKPQPPALCDLMRFGHEFSVAGRDYRSPYGKPGDRLWVRETFAWSGDESIPKSERLERGEVWYRADPERDNPAIRWRPSIFMPRWASRILLEVTQVRVERVQKIFFNTDDIKREGLRPRIRRLGPGAEGCVPNDLREQWIELWDSINAKPKPIYRTINRKKFIDHYVSYPWSDIGPQMREHRGKPWLVYSNPWVWCVSFKRIDAK